MTKFKRYALKALSLLWDATLIALFIYMCVVLGGCTPLTATEHRDRAERQMLACKRTGHVWISPAGKMHAGKCDWNRSIL